ncbi:MAG: SpoIIE family protein phosphatase [Firmicutes bacterium]|jgi:stage II sporulation protein E|nr:SpoIIE family protein phosphatase [Bacillota bacterium]
MADERVGVFRREKRRAGDALIPHKKRSDERKRQPARPRLHPRLHPRLRIARISKLVAFGAVGFVAGIVRLFGAYSPFGIAVVGAAAACCDSDAVGVMPTIAGALLGGALSGGPTQVVALAVSSAFFLALPERVKTWTVWCAGLGAFVASFIGAVLAQAIVGQGVYLPVIALSEAAIAGAAAAVMIPAARSLRGSGGALRLPSRLDAAALLLAAGIACVGLDQIRFWGVSPGAILAFYVSAFAGMVAGPGGGGIAGASVGMAMSAVGKTGAIIAMATAAAGTAAGVIGRQGRAFAALMIPLAAMFAGRQLGTGDELTGFLIESCAAAILLMATSSRWVGEITWRLPREAGAAGLQDEYRARVHHLVSERLLADAGAFQDLALAYSGAPMEPLESVGLRAVAAPAAATATAGPDRDDTGGPPQNIASSVAAVRARTCLGCASYDVCWKELFFRTYRDIVDALAVAELYAKVDAAGLPKGLGARCSRREALAEAASRVGRPTTATGPGAGAALSTEPSFSVPLDVAAAMLSLQTAGVARALTRAAMRAQSIVASDEDTEREVRGRLRRAGIEVRCLSVAHTGHEGLEVQVVKTACGRADECVRTVAPVVSGAVGRAMSVWDRQCSLQAPGEASTECTVRLASACRFLLETESLSAPGLENGVNGDSRLLVNLVDGKVAILISDGMGVGEAAAKQSRAAVSALARLLAAGLDAAFAVENVNALMSLQPDPGPFTTLDVALIDLHTGDAEIIKAGAPPTYIRRGSRVTALGSPSAPAGVSIPAHTATFHTVLEEGDIVVWATDGITEGRGDVADVDGELARLIQQAPGGCASSVAQVVMNWARAGAPVRGGPGSRPLRDDMTVFVGRLARATAAAGIGACIVERSIPEGEANGRERPG